MKVVMLNDNATMPTRGSTEAAGYDLYAAEDKLIEPGETVKVGTGLAMAVPTGYCGLIFARSGLATKQGLRPANCVGLVDSDYRGEWIVALHNDSAETRAVHAGDRIAQMVIMPYMAPELEPALFLDETERGAGGFGSTGK